MRLLYLDSDKSLCIEEFFGNKVPSYAILSHTWGPASSEVTYKDISQGTGKGKAGYEKIRFCGEKATSHSLKYFWVDTCCIDKSNSTELQQAITSMFRWYHDAARCYVYMSDVSTSDCDMNIQYSQLPWESAFRASRWFTRGWTLQELLAPPTVEFFSKEGNRLGDKHVLGQQIHEITGIAITALQGRPLAHFSVAERLSWVENRQTTIEEDKAYCLFGIFDVYLPLIYGERQNAFARLQDEIDRSAMRKNANAARLREGVPEEKVGACLNALFLTDPQVDRESLISAKGTRVDGTCEWILENESYRSWVHGETSLLWISGGPGKGKTMLSIFLTEDQGITQQSECTELIFYFCSHQDKTRNSGISILRGLLYQIIRKRQNLATHLLPYFETPEKALQTLSSLEALWIIFRALLQDTNLGTMFCVLDGLDECDEDTIRILVPKILDILSPKNEGLATTTFKLVIVSRDILDMHGCMQIKLDPDHDERLASDIKQFISSRVQKLSRIDGFNDKLRETVQKTLLERSEGTFLWAGLVMIELYQKKTCTEVVEALESLPRGLPAIYGRMLLQIEDRHRQRCSTILRWVTMALRPLTLQELSTAIGIVPTSAGIAMDQAIRDRIAHCGPFLKVQGQTVHLVHQSARDYLLRKNCDINTVLEGFRIKLEAAHLELARTCLDCVTHSCLQDTPLIGVVNVDQTYLRESVLLKYAIIYWPEHARRSSTLARELFSVSMPFFRKKSKLRKNWWLTYFYSRNIYFHHSSPPLLHIACYLGIVPWVEVILDKSRMPRLLKPIDKKDIEKRTPLRWAVQAGQEAVVRLLLSRGADTNIEDDEGWTALCCAACKGHETIVRLLVDHGADINIGDNDGQTVLCYAALGGHETTVRLLVDRGADINIGDNDGQTALFYAAREGQETIVRLLLEYGVDVNRREMIV